VAVCPWVQQSGQCARNGLAGSLPALVSQLQPHNTTQNAFLMLVMTAANIAMHIFCCRYHVLGSDNLCG